MADLLKALDAMLADVVDQGAEFKASKHLLEKLIEAREALGGNE